MTEPIAFGQAQGQTARLFHLESPLLRARISDFGGTLVALETPDRAGAWGPVVLSLADAASYATSHGSFGMLIGRYANRIAGGTVVIDGQSWRLAQNDGDTTLHGGPAGFGMRFWSVAHHDQARLVLTLTSADGDQGFPGALRVEAIWRVDGPALHLTFRAETNKPTPLSLTAHPYFNLDGAGAGDCLAHRLEIIAPAMLPTDARQIPTGEIRPVAGTVFDFATPRRIGERIYEPDPQLRLARGYDHCFVLAGEPGTLRLAARVAGARSGRILELLTTQPALQVYSGNNLDGSVASVAGMLRQSAGFALEPQAYPNAPNQPSFPSAILRPGEVYREEIVYRFSIGDRP